MELMWVGENRTRVRILVTSVLSLFAAILYSRWRRVKAVHAVKKQFGCEDPAQYPHQDVMGSDLAQLRMEAMKEGRFFKLYASQFERYGKTWQENWRGKPLINTTEPANVQQVAALAFGDYGKDPERVKAQAPFFGPSVFSDGPSWKEGRAMVKPIFARAEISDMDHLISFVDRFMELIPDDGGMVDMQPLLHRLFLDVSMDFIFGRSLNALQTDVPGEYTEFMQAFSQGQRGVTQRRESGWLQFRLHRYKESSEWKDAYTKVHRFVDQQVARALRETTNMEPESDEPVVQRRYVLLDEMAKHIRDPMKLRYHVLGVFAPARDTTSILMGNTLFQLARHPHVWTRLRQISLELGDTPLTFEKLKSLVDFRNVVHETIRVCGPAARIWRVAVRDTILPVGGGPDQKSPVFVPRGTPVVLGSWSMNHDKDLWGDDVDEFKPDRWIGRKPLWEFTPFHGGPRICPAQQQVLTYSIYLLVRLTQKFQRMDNCDTVFEYIEKWTLGFESRNGVKVAFKNN